MMRSFLADRIIPAVLILSVLVVGLFGVIVWRKNHIPKPVPVAESVQISPKHSVIGTSVEGRKIETYTYGHGATYIAFIGGIHGGYEWNSVLLAYQFIDYLTANLTTIPSDLTITVIPSANPDGVYKVIGKEGRFTVADVPTNVSTAPGRMNANNVDLNRNFDCNWKPQSTWQSKTVSGGTMAFSEPETKVIRDFILADKPVAVVFWHSMSGTVYASQCKTGILPATLDIMNAYAQASGYKMNKSFDSYAITGDAEGWLASINIPAITVELTTHETIEWEQNLAGIKALFKYYSQVTR